MEEFAVQICNSSIADVIVKSVSKNYFCYLDFYSQQEENIASEVYLLLMQNLRSLRRQ